MPNFVMRFGYRGKLCCNCQKFSDFRQVVDKEVEVGIALPRALF